MTRDTVGKISRDLIIGAPELDHSPHEQMRESLTDYEDNVHLAVDAGKKKYHNDFYVVVFNPSSMAASYIPKALL